jgi:hypothetical protein
VSCDPRGSDTGEVYPFSDRRTGLQMRQSTLRFDRSFKEIRFNDDSISDRHAWIDDAADLGASEQFLQNVYSPAGARG